MEEKNTAGLPAGNGAVREEHYDRPRRPWLKYVIAFGVGLVLMALTAWSGGLFSGEQMSELDKIRHWSDAFFTAGMLLAASGALVFVSRNGAFDGLSYAVVSLSWFFRNRQHESYADYKARKAERGKTPCLFLVIVGGGFLLIALILVILFLQKEGTLTTP